MYEQPLVRLVFNFPEKTVGIGVSILPPIDEVKADETLLVVL